MILADTKTKEIKCLMLISQVLSQILQDNFNLMSETDNKTFPLSQITYFLCTCFVIRQDLSEYLNQLNDLLKE